MNNLCITETYLNGTIRVLGNLTESEWITIDNALSNLNSIQNLKIIEAIDKVYIHLLKYNLNGFIVLVENTGITQRILIQKIITHTCSITSETLV